MAEILLSPLFDKILSFLGSAFVEEMRVVWGVEEEIQALSSTLSAIKSLMADADERQLQSNTIRDWLGKLKDVAYDAEDVVDEFSLKALEAQQAGDVIQSKKRKKVRNFPIPDSLKKFLFRHEIGNKIRDIGKRLDDIAKERFQFHLWEMSAAKPIQTREGPHPGPLIDASTVLGREEEKHKLIKQLLGSNESISEKHLIVIPIVGMGGLGKTTFARLVYNNEEVKQHFQVRGWVCASDRFEWRRVAKEIVESITGNKCIETHPEVHLQNLIQGKRFLVVIDDVWDDALNYWDDFRVPFIYGDKGSKLLVTTRSEKVSIIGTSVPFSLEFLPDEDCLKLFLRKVFVNGDEERYPNLVDIGKMILKKCGGVPLAVNTLGGLLTFTRSESEWNGVLESSFWNLPENENSILSALRLSYYHLPSKVKPCFLFCSIFPKDWKFDKGMLIRMWMALGYIQPDRWREEEDVGNEYFNDLLMRSFFSHAYQNEYTMHDLVHDLAESLAEGDCFKLHNDNLDLIREKNNIPHRVRHASLFLSDVAEKVNFDVIKSFRGLHTFVSEIDYLECDETDYLECVETHYLEFDMTLIAELNYLYVLSLHCCKIERLPNVICCLRLLRYLDLSFCDIKELPDSICSLSYLQTLNLEGCSNLKKLPKNITTLTKLRYLNVRFCGVTCMPSHFGKLTNLRELSEFFVEKEAGKTIVELKGLNKLKGSFTIRGLENVVDGEEAKEAHLKNKQLQSLDLGWTFHSVEYGSAYEDVLENLHPHINLEKLTLTSYMGSCLPRWLFNLLSLKELVLWHCENLEPEDLGKLKSLERLFLCNCKKMSSLRKCWLPKSLREFWSMPMLYSCRNFVSDGDAS